MEEAPPEEEIDSWAFDGPCTEEVLAAMQAEPDKLDEFKGYTPWRRGSNASKPLTLTWVRELRSAKPEARLYARPFGLKKRCRDEL